MPHEPPPPSTQRLAFGAILWVTLLSKKNYLRETGACDAFRPSVLLFSQFMRVNNRDGCPFLFARAIEAVRTKGSHVQDADMGHHDPPTCRARGCHDHRPHRRRGRHTAPRKEVGAPCRGRMCCRCHRTNASLYGRRTRRHTLVGCAHTTRPRMVFALAKQKKRGIACNRCSFFCGTIRFPKDFRSLYRGDLQMWVF